MPTFNVLFEGVTPGPARDIVAEAIQVAKPNLVVMPAAGRFGSTEAVIKRGFPADKVWTSDMGLFSSIIGYLADPSKQLLDLGITHKGEASQFFRSPDLAENMEIDYAVSCFLAMKWAQVTPRHQYGINLRRDLLNRVEFYRERLTKELTELLTGLGPLHYDIMDLREHIASVKDDPNVAIYLNPPAYDPEGYASMFSNPDLDWGAKIALESPWDKQALAELFDFLVDAQALCLVYSIGGESVPPDWTKLYGIRKKGDRHDYVVANRDPGVTVRKTIQPIFSAPPQRFPIYDDHEITPDSEIMFVEIERPTAMYYRDLFVHRLGSVNSEWYLGLLVDGQLTTVLGLNRADFMRFKVPYIRETFGITISSKRYSRLGKLFMMLLTTNEFYAWSRKHTRQGIRKAIGIQTTSLTKHPEGKTDRGVLKVVKREQLPHGTWRLVYASDFRDLSFSDAVGEWLDKHGKKVRRG
jgi:hypothetical protein